MHGPRFIAGIAAVLMSCVVCVSALGNDYYASPSGRSTNSGSFASPWDLQTALTKSTSIHGGDTLWLRGGTYTNPPGKTYTGIGTDSYIWRSTISGSSATSPIKVRPYQNERVILDASLAGVSNGRKNITAINLEGNYVWYQDFELTNSDPERILLTTDPGGDESNRPDRRGNGFDDRGSYNRLLNVIIHDTGQGMSAWSNGQGGEYRGVLDYNNGWATLGGLHGHGIYTQNANAAKQFINNIVLPQFGLGMQVYGSDQATLRNYSFDGNTFVKDRYLVGGGSGPAQNFTFTNNYFYYSRLELSYGDNGGTGATLTNNWFIGGVAFRYWKNVTITDNYICDLSASSPRHVGISFKTGDLLTDYTFDRNHYYRSQRGDPMEYSVSFPGDGRLYRFNNSIGWNPYPRWQEDARYDVNGTYVNDTVRYKPSGTFAYARANGYAAGRGQITIYNWDQLATVAVNASGLGLVAGDIYELRYAGNYFNDVLTRTYDGSGFINVPMTGHVNAQPVGWSSVVANGSSIGDQAAYTDLRDWIETPVSPEFGVFLLIRTQAATIPPAPTNLTATAGNSQVALSWGAATGAITYNLKRSTTSGGPYSTVRSGLAATNWTDTGLTNGTPYYYVVTALNGAGESGNSNQATATPFAPPTVLAASYDYSTPQHKLVVQFSSNVSASLIPADVSIADLYNVPPTTVTVSSISYNSTTNTATFDLSPAILSDGNYRATFLANGITDASGNKLDGNSDGTDGDNYILDFFFLKGDANHDRIVDVGDLAILGSNWQQSPRGFGEADFNYDGIVDVGDLAILGSSWQKSLPVPPPAPVAPALNQAGGERAPVAAAPKKLAGKRARK